MTPDELLADLAASGIAVSVHHHPAVFTVAQSASLKAGMPGGHSKNLFLKDRKGRLFLVVAAHDTTIDLKRLHEPLGAAGRLSFGSADLLRETFGVEPGSVTPFAVANDQAGAVEVILDADLLPHARVHFHPLVNTMTVGLAPDELLAWLDRARHTPRVMRLHSPTTGAAAAAIPSPSHGP